MLNKGKNPLPVALREGGWIFCLNSAIIVNEREDKFMKFKFPYKGYNSRELVRRCNYGEWYDREYDKISYTRKLGGGNYPRFHVYLTDFDNYFEVDLHLDQKQASYGVGHAHSGEYEGETVEEEARRITAMIADIFANKK